MSLINVLKKKKIPTMLTSIGLIVFFTTIIININPTIFTIQQQYNVTIQTIAALLVLLGSLLYFFT